MKVRHICQGPQMREIQLALFDGNLLKYPWLCFQIEKDSKDWAVRLHGAERILKDPSKPEWRFVGRAAQISKQGELPRTPNFDVAISYNMETREGKLRFKVLPLGSTW